jgi:hypothetical protein
MATKSDRRETGSGPRRARAATTEEERERERREKHIFLWFRARRALIVAGWRHGASLFYWVEDEQQQQYAHHFSIAS